jgi:MarR family 2-MHQ and catechol resistance regulon transcriptional repressor
MGTRYGGTVPEIRALDAYIKLMRCAHAVSARLDPALARHGLTETQFGVLETLLHLGPLPHRALGRKNFKSTSNMTTVIDNLERRGLVRRVPDEADGRRVAVHLTRKGHTLIRRIFPGHVEAIVREFSVLSATEQEALGQLCKKLGLRQEDHLPSPRGR